RRTAHSNHEALRFVHGAWLRISQACASVFCEVSPVRRAILPVTLALCGCGSEVVAHKLQEKEANQIVEVLSEKAGVDADKIAIDTGREVYFNVAVRSGR